MTTITELMVRDHERLASLLNDFKNTKNKNVKKSKEIFNKLDTELRNHLSAEEKIIKLVFSKKTSNALPIAESIKLEHKRIRNMLTNISNSLSNNTEINTENLFLILRHHKNIEDRLLYPELDEIVSEKEKIIILEKII